MAQLLSLTFTIITLCTFAQDVLPEKIVVLSFFTSKSMRNVLDPYLNEVAARGHQITVISPIPGKQVSGIRNIYGPTMVEELDKMGNIFDLRLSLGRSVNPLLLPIFEGICHGHYQVPEVQELQKEKFDLVIVNGLTNECVYGLVDHWNTTTISIVTIAAPIWVASAFGAPTPASFVPLHLYGLTHQMNFAQRLHNLLWHWWILLLRKYVFAPRMERIYRTYFPNARSVQEIDRDLSMVMMNSHPLINYPRPLLPDMVEFGGIHCRPAKPLPNDLEEFISGSGPDGFILFSLGTIVRGSDMPDRFRLAILNTFAKLKQRVLWKWETETMPDLPPNVKLSSWLPQQDLLGHPRIKLFITHGGLLSTEEAVYHGVPLLGIPMVVDQDLNVQQAEYHGYALKLELGTITEEYFTIKINTILQDDRFTKKAKHLSTIFRDQPNTPLERMIFWTEYVMRHKGAKHLRSSGRDLNFVQYHSIDVLAFLAGISLFAILLVYFGFRWIFRKIVSRIFVMNVDKKKL